MQKRQRTYLKIDLDALNHNLLLIKQKAKSAKIMAVIKSNAYGHGSVVLSKYLNDKVDFLGVATVPEAVELRKAGVTLPILILGNIFEADLADVLDFDITVSISCTRIAKMLQNSTQDVGKTIKAHIAVDTGMNRLGFKPDEIGQIVEISRLKNLKIEGIYTHYACADQKDKSKVKKQQACFEEFLSVLKTQGIDPKYKHISNSAAVIDLNDTHYSLVRTGIMLYGLYPSEGMKKSIRLKPIMSWHASISHIKMVKKGEGISYGHTYITDRPTKVATIPVGYADGYPRALSNKASVLINGQLCPVIGRICMDQFMVDVTHVKNLSIDSEATLIGKGLPIEALAAQAESINYEFITGLSTRIQRIYISKSHHKNKK